MNKRAKCREGGKNIIYVAVGEKEKQQLYYYNKPLHWKDKYQYVNMYFS